MDLAGSKRPSYSAADLFSNSDCSGPDRITLGCWQISFSKEAAYFDNGNPTGKLQVFHGDTEPTAAYTPFKNTSNSHMIHPHSIIIRKTGMNQNTEKQ